MLNSDQITSIEFHLGSVDVSRMEVHYAQNYWYMLSSDTSVYFPDIAIFKLATPVTYGSTIQPIRLPSDNVEQFVDWGSIIMGFGRDENGVETNYLLYGTFTISSNPSCGYAYYQICSLAASSNPTTSLQGGDVGAPWIVYNGGIPTQIGVTTGWNWNSTLTWNRAMRVSTFIDWIGLVSGIRY